MDYEANRLSSGLLQLSDNTHLIVDETRLEAGKLDASGVGNVQALRTLITHQIVNYDFQFYSKPYDADVPVLILSEGKSLLPCNMLVPLKADTSCLNTLPEIFQAANHFLREPLITEIRLYLSVMRHSDYEFPENLQTRAQEDFVQMRQTGGQNVSADDLHLLLVLARLLSLSNGEKIVSLEAWEQAKAMEAERKLRISSNSGQTAQSANEP
ncbi:Mini-chromosome maintenance complex-binding protein [Frankliniella fusca]|uniref:Mini-chromosome maintenance complex-binding protein n=1 Tax=Frankliniella fusca TaxID=407009 RepID=A0AAE1LJV9_9NEOP|nr:Mini-chromosome maintenance complex-binding protein [Frankliniella fusca]